MVRLGGRGIGNVAEEAGAEYAGPVKRVRQGGPYECVFSDQ